MAPSKDKTAAASTSRGSSSAHKRRNAVSFKDVQIVYLMDGVAAVEQLLKSGQASRSTVRRALSELKASGKNVTELERWVAVNVGSSGRGRSTPSPGESRSYKAQQVKAGGPFLRLPLDVLGVEKGGVVRVHFGNGEIVVSR